ncbi:MAG: carbohydrate ABC transporter permease [Caldilineaceae bacterium]
MANQTIANPMRGSAQISKRPRRFTSKRFRENFVRTVATILVTIGAVIALFPIAWMLSTSLKGPVEALKMPPNWIPSKFHWENYYEALVVDVPFARYFYNSFYYAIMVMVAEVVSVSFIAFGFARLRAPGRNALFLLVLATLMLPYHATLIPQYYLFSKLHLTNSYFPLIFPHWFGSAYLIFMVRQFYLGIPSEYDEAALIEGASYFAIWYKIIIPLSKATLGAMAIMSFMYHYNDFIGPMIYINDNYNFPVQLGLSMFRAPYGGTPYHLLMAASLAVIVPCVVIFFIFQRYFIQGVVVSGVKG